MRDIDAGEELTTDYALFDDYEGSMECRCTRPLCRGRIDGHDWNVWICKNGTGGTSPGISKGGSGPKADLPQ